jgi:hypothetical protein
MRNASKYSVDLVSSDGFADFDMQYDTDSLEKAEKRFDAYVKNKAFPFERVQLWSRLKNDNDIELVKEAKGELVVKYEESAN